MIIQILKILIESGVNRYKKNYFVEGFYFPSSFVKLRRK